MTLPRGQRSWPCWKMCTTTRVRPRAGTEHAPKSRRCAPIL